MKNCPATLCTVQNRQLKPCRGNSHTVQVFVGSFTVLLGETITEKYKPYTYSTQGQGAADLAETPAVIFH